MQPGHPSAKLKIQFVFNFCPPYRIAFFEYLATRYDINYLFFSGGEEAYYDQSGGVHLGNFRGRYLRGFSLLPKLRLNPGLIPELWWRPADVIIKCINGPLPLLLAYAAAKMRGIPFILWTGIWHDLDTGFHRLAAPLVRRIYRGADAIVVYGDHVKNYLVDRGIEPGKIFPAYQAHDTSKFLRPVPAGDVAALRRKLGVNTPHVILYVGRFVQEKGLAYLLEAYGRLEEETCTLLLLGAGNTAGALRERAAGLPRVVVREFVPNDALPVYYALADIFVLPSITTPAFREPWGFVINEAMAQGCAVIATDAVGAARGGLLEHGVDGLVVPERNAGALARALQQVLEDTELRHRLQQAARQKMAGWDVEMMARGFEAAIAFACRGRNPSPAPGRKDPACKN